MTFAGNGAVLKYCSGLLVLCVCDLYTYLNSPLFNVILHNQNCSSVQTSSNTDYVSDVC